MAQVAPPPGETAFLDDTRAAVRLGVQGGALFLAGVAGIPVTVVWGENYWAAWLLTVIFLAVGGGLLLLVVPRLLHRATPFLVIGPQGFRCPGLAGPTVPWADVAHGVVSGESGSVVTGFVFKPGAVLPERDGSRANVRVSRRRHAVFIRGPSPRGMDLEEYSARIAAAIEEAGEDPVSRTP